MALPLVEYVKRVAWKYTRMLLQMPAKDVVKKETHVPVNMMQGIPNVR